MLTLSQHMVLPNLCHQHAIQWKRSKVSQGIALRLPWIYDTTGKYKSSDDEYKNYLWARDYKSSLDEQLDSWWTVQKDQQNI